jgi:hypothetical protein
MLSASNVGKCDCIWVLFSKISKAFLLDNSGNELASLVDIMESIKQLLD